VPRRQRLLKGPTPCSWETPPHPALTTTSPLRQCSLIRACRLCANARSSRPREPVHAARSSTGRQAAARHAARPSPWPRRRPHQALPAWDGWGLSACMAAPAVQGRNVSRGGWPARGVQRGVDLCRRHEACGPHWERLRGGARPALLRVGPRPAAAARAAAARARARRTVGARLPLNTLGTRGLRPQPQTQPAAAMTAATDAALSPRCGAIVVMNNMRAHIYPFGC